MRRAGLFSRPTVFSGRVLSVEPRRAHARPGEGRRMFVPHALASTNL